MKGNLVTRAVGKCLCYWQHRFPPLQQKQGRGTRSDINFSSWKPGPPAKTDPIALVFKPNATQIVDVATLQSQKIIPADAYWAAVVLSAPVQPDDLMAIA